MLPFEYISHDSKIYSDFKEKCVFLDISLNHIYISDLENHTGKKDIICRLQMVIQCEVVEFTV